jgi:hypothetical protein
MAGGGGAQLKEMSFVTRQNGNPFTHKDNGSLDGIQCIAILFFPEQTANSCRDKNDKYHLLG